jgi:hypothetical protein
MCSKLQNEKNQKMSQLPRSRVKQPIEAILEEGIDVSGLF